MKLIERLNEDLKAYSIYKNEKGILFNKNITREKADIIRKLREAQVSACEKKDESILATAYRNAINQLSTHKNTELKRLLQDSLNKYATQKIKKANHQSSQANQLVPVGPNVINHAKTQAQAMQIIASDGLLDRLAEERARYVQKATKQEREIAIELIALAQSMGELFKMAGASTQEKGRDCLKSLILVSVEATSARLKQLQFDRIPIVTPGVLALMNSNPEGGYAAHGSNIFELPMPPSYSATMLKSY